jgi:hypothetical protein
MISAKLVKDLEKRGFELDFPGFGSTEEELLEIIKSGNQRFFLAIPVLLREPFDYAALCKKLSRQEKSIFNNIVLMANAIFKAEKIENTHLTDAIKRYKMKGKIDKAELERYHSAFNETLQKSLRAKEAELEEQATLRDRLGTNKALSNIFSPGKMRIMEKIFNHEPLTNTELKYYYRSIRPLIESILNDSLQKYCRTIGSAKKYHE